jgi:hypothetical protein
MSKFGSSAAGKGDWNRTMAYPAAKQRFDEGYERIDWRPECPECGSKNLQKQGRCSTCLDCGASSCG